MTKGRKDMKVNEIIKTIHGNIEVCFSDALNKNNILLINKEEISRRCSRRKDENNPMREFFYLDNQCIFVSYLYYDELSEKIIHEITEAKDE